jgi:hypothetical protein
MLTMAWQVTHGPGSVIGLAPSATAAAQLAISLRIPCETTTKWLHQHDEAASSGPATAAAPPLAAGTVVIVDEASMASTAHLDTVLESAYLAWRADLDAGHESLLIAADRITVTNLNLRARIDRISAGHVNGPEAGLHDGTSCAAGDWITTRRNERRLAVPGGGFVRNGDTWQVVQVYPDGSIDARTRSARAEAEGAVVQLPPQYVAEHVELGYATTVHRAQGATVDSAHTVVTPAMTRQSLYVAMTRGREANHAHIDTSGRPGIHYDTEAHLHDQQKLNGRQILEQVTATDGTKLSATATLRQRQDAAVSPSRLRPIRDTLATAAGEPDAERALAEINALLAARRDRPGRTAAAAAGLQHPRAHTRDNGPTITGG